MKKKNIIILISIVIILIIILKFFTNFTSFIILDPNSIGNSDFCVDTDGSFNLLEQSKISGRVFWIHKTGNWSQINRINSTNDIPIWQLNYIDFCLNKTTVRERTCFNNKIGSENIKCQTSCYIGRCL